MTHLWSALLALCFAVSTVGAESHQCPEHDRQPGTAPAHADAHDHGDAPASDAHGCTCPQVCGTSPAVPLVPSAPTAFTVAVTPTLAGAVSRDQSVLIPAVPHRLPLALAPPRTLV